MLGLVARIALLATLAATPQTAFAAGERAAPVRLAESRTMIWNGVAVDGRRIFVSGPRWTGARGAQLARLDIHGRARPYPSAAWNAWQPGRDVRRAFVNINAIHLDGRGGLWAVDTGSPKFGGDPLPGGAKLVRMSLASGHVDRILPLGPALAGKGSYIDDIRFNGDKAYLTDAGRPGLIVLDLRTGQGRRVLDGHAATTARSDRPIVLDGERVLSPDGVPLRIHADPLEVSPDGAWLYFGPLEGPWSRVPTRLLDDPRTEPSRLAEAVRTWADLPPVGGTAMGRDGSLFFTELSTDSVKRRLSDGRIEVLVSDPALHWADAPFLAKDGRLYLPVAQLDRVALFHRGRSRVHWPVGLYVVDTRR